MSDGNAPNGTTIYMFVYYSPGPTFVTMRCMMDNYGTAYVNGKLVGTVGDSTWAEHKYFIFGAQLLEGRNLIEAHVVNTGGPSGVLLDALSNGAYLFGTDSRWTCSPA